ncbi:cation-efflux pump [Terriglobus tenax]|uniref:cation-efflux pump n=1 Tax=Terriglobus tenax TaxID=1111115 RepID=UPI0021E01FCD|nr:cation-efflux pump [Terriglobus tenax]
MPAAVQTQNPTAPQQEKRRAALSSVLAAAGVTALKLITGLITGSLGMLSEAAHSGLDLAAAGITLFSVHVSDKPADEDHNFGHGKIENLSAFVEIFLMGASCFWIVFEAVKRLIHPIDIRHSIWPFLVLLVSIAVDYGRSRHLFRVAKESGSQALEADAVHFSTDIWSSVAVLLGLAAAWIGERYDILWLHRADPVAALLVSVIILQVSYRLARRTLDALMDATPAETRHELMQAIAHVPDVLSVDQVRVRQAGPEYFVDLTLALDRNLTFQRAEQVTRGARAAVQRILPGADIDINTVPTATESESVFDRVKAVAARRNLGIHDLSVREISGRLHIELHLEVPEVMRLRAAHDLVTSLETEMRREEPRIDSILTHIESEPTTIEHTDEVARDSLLERGLRRAAQDFPQILDIHEVLITRTGDHLQINCHCTLPDDLPMAEVHRIITEVESIMKRQHPEVTRVLIHPEPATDNER